MVLIGIDIGGTFTDLVCLSDEGLTTAKVASTPEDFSKGFMDALEAAGVSPPAVDRIVHGTTVATNALLERKGARCGFITTEGFRDVLELRRRNRRRPYGIQTAFEPLISRAFRMEVEERASGDEIDVRPRAAEVQSRAAGLVGLGAEVIVIGFLHSATHPENERAAVEALEALSVPVIASTDVSDEPTEFERFSTAAASGFVTPLIRSYVSGIENALAESGSRSSFSIVTNDGGLVAGADAGRVAVRTALSGPAAGVWGSRHLCRALGISDFVACDMGGTSFDACLVTGGAPALTESRELDFGLPLALPMLDIATIGAGGGSVVKVGALGDLEIGPEGLGASPGPACYGKQAHQVAVTDANVVLGRLGERLVLPTGVRALETSASRRTLSERVASPLGLDVEDAASMIVYAVEAKMADRIRDLALERRLPLDDFVLLAYGGAGPMHAAGIAAELGVSRVLIPPRAGAFSAWGGLLAQGREHRVARVDLPVDESGVRQVRAITAEQIGELVGGREASDPGVASTHTVEVDLAYEGQIHTVAIPIADPGNLTANALTRDFENRYGATGTLMPVPLRVRRVISTVVSGAPPALQALLSSIGSSAELDAASEREVWFGGEWITCPVLPRDSVTSGQRVSGPCILEEPGATIVVPPGALCRPIKHGVLEIDGIGGPQN